MAQAGLPEVVVRIPSVLVSTAAQALKSQLGVGNATTGQTKMVVIGVCLSSFRSLSGQDVSRITRLLSRLVGLQMGVVVMMGSL